MWAEGWGALCAPARYVNKILRLLGVRNGDMGGQAGAGRENGAEFKNLFAVLKGDHMEGGRETPRSPRQKMRLWTRFSGFSGLQAAGRGRGARRSPGVAM